MALGKSLASLGLEVNICKINHQGPSVWCGGPEQNSENTKKQLHSDSGAGRESCLCVLKSI